MKKKTENRKPLIYYYAIVMIVLTLFNIFVAPVLMEKKVSQVDYGTFMRMIEERNVEAYSLKVRRLSLPTETINKCMPQSSR